MKTILNSTKNIKTHFVRCHFPICLVNPSDTKQAITGKIECRLKVRDALLKKVNFASRNLFEVVAFGFHHVCLIDIAERMN
jgi:hypothetical protein